MLGFWIVIVIMTYLTILAFIKAHLRVCHSKALMTKAKRGDRDYGKIFGSGLPWCIKNRTREKYLS